MNKALASVSALLLCTTSVFAQGVFDPNPTPKKDAPAAPATPVQTPGQDPAAPAAPQEFPGPRGTKITFPTGLYDEAAVPAKQIADAIAIAKAEDKRVLLMFGENFCGFCVFLNDVLKNDPNVAPVVKTEYVWVKIDLGQKFTKNQAVAEQYGVTLWTPRPDGTSLGAPALSVIDPATGRHVAVIGGNDMTAKPMTMSRVFDENKIFQFLMDNRAASKNADTIFSDAKSIAGRDGKPMLVAFTMPLHEPSAALSAWLTRPDVAATLGNIAVPVRIDTERMTGGGDLLTKINGKATLPPLIAMLDSKGDAIKDLAPLSALPKTDGEIEAFIKNLAKANPKLSDADKAVLSKSLREVGKPVEKK